MQYKTKNIFFGIFWVAAFSVLAWYIGSGKLFEPDANGKMHVIALLFAWIAEYISKIGTALLVLVLGLVIGIRVARSKD